MAKLKIEATNQLDLIEYLDGYSDFSFELTVLKMLREHDVDCDHGGHYVDPVTNKSREFDIRATKTINKYRVRMSVECKNIRENFSDSCLVCHDTKMRVTTKWRWSPIPSAIQICLPRRLTINLCAKVLDIRDAHSLYSGDPVGKSTVQVGRMDGSIRRMTVNSTKSGASVSVLCTEW